MQPTDRIYKFVFSNKVILPRAISQKLAMSKNGVQCVLKKFEVTEQVEKEVAKKEVIKMISVERYHF